MVAIGVALVWLGYTSGLYGYCLLRGYNITPRQLLSRTWPPGNISDSKSPLNQQPGLGGALSGPLGGK